MTIMELYNNLINGTIKRLEKELLENGVVDYNPFDIGRELGIDGNELEKEITRYFNNEGYLCGSCFNENYVYINSRLYLNKDYVNIKR